jgi:glutamine synthetase-like protein
MRGWAAIHESDMLLIPDPKTAFMDPFAETPTVMYGDVKDPITKQRYERDPRYAGLSQLGLHYIGDRDLHRLQAQERGRCHPSAAAPLRVRPVLRHLAYGIR